MNCDADGKIENGRYLSAVAGVADANGLNRVVVTELHNMHHHLCLERDEKLFIVPNFWISEPLAYEDYGRVIETARNYTIKELSGQNACGECRACCVAPPIRFPEHTKNAHQPCDRLCSHGCGRYKERPQVCREFECSWLKSQNRNDVMGPELRPDRCGVFFIDRDTIGNDPLVFEVHLDPSRQEVINSPVVREYIDEMERAGYKAKFITYYTAPA